MCFLGRFMPEKGPLVAIGTARALGLRLLLAGPRNAYYRERIAPLVDGRHVEYVGYVTGRHKDQLLGRARALLYPIQYPEPFGLVMAEAMMCGTPVAALRLGAVPEIIDEGVAARRCPLESATGGSRFALNPAAGSGQAESRFSAERMRASLRVYERLVTGSARSLPLEGTAFSARSTPTSATRDGQDDTNPLVEMDRGSPGCGRGKGRESP
jgi:glycosyltransferase involved in cell wall biosynthesis